MTPAQPKPTLLRDYTPPNFTVDTIDLTFDLREEETIVDSSMELRRIYDDQQGLILHGESLELLSIMIDGAPLSSEDYLLDDHHLRILTPKDHFNLSLRVKINPHKNSELEGLYRSGEIFCTQNEPHGFRRITFFIDRPDVLAIYRTKIIADQRSYPHLLSNGNLIEEGRIDEGRHYAIWYDPFPKPSYLFALVAGSFDILSDEYTTKNGRQISLKVYTDPGQAKYCHHALASLKRAMQWDEESYGLEYDLDSYMIVAVEAFNMGAMENKGLNIFNISCVLADLETATDDEYKRVESVIAHEYFHNWTGNRVTLRDWFQLTLKEGLTVYRDQEFSASLHDRGVERIEQVRFLRKYQFPEDRSRRAHPIQPTSFIEINNFYTRTIYRKGAEVIRMLCHLLGEASFIIAIRHYLQKHDGKAATVEDFLLALEESSNRDLRRFRRWYSTKGTPSIVVDTRFDEISHCYTIFLEMSLSDQTLTEENALEIPLGFALFSPQGELLREGLLTLTSPTMTVHFDAIQEPPILSLNRHFTAPIQLSYPLSPDQMIVLLQYESDSFSRFEAAQKLFEKLIFERYDEKKAVHQLPLPFKEALSMIIRKESNPLLKSELLSLPSLESLAEERDVIDFVKLEQARNSLEKSLGEELEELFLESFQSIDYAFASFADEEMGKRRCKLSYLRYLVKTGKEPYLKLAMALVEERRSMTEEAFALTLLCHTPSSLQERAIDLFYQRWNHFPLAIDKWLQAQSSSPLDGTLQRVQNLLHHPAFIRSNPNKVHALIGSFGANLAQVHKEDGLAYHFLIEFILSIDQENSLLASSLMRPFQWRDKVLPPQKKKIDESLEAIVSQHSISKGLFEMAQSLLGKNP